MHVYWNVCIHTQVVMLCGTVCLDRSYGIVLWEVMQFGMLPYSDLSNELVLRLVVKECSVRPTKPDSPISNIDRV